MPGRGWELWSEIKLDVLDQYLGRFLQTTKNKSEECIYLDLFAGKPENFLRTTGKSVAGSASLALGKQDPPFTKIALFELATDAASLETFLKSQYPNVPFRMFPGDCNVTLETALCDLKSVDWAPTFAFVDPDGPQCRWSTLELLSLFKSSASRTKAEFWLLFPTMFMRQLPLNGAPFRLEDSELITAMFGVDQWKQIFEARRSNEIGGEEARNEYVNLMRWRIQERLGYKWTHPPEIPNEHGNPIYTMIFATDHDAGTRIMSSLYKKAAQRFPAMRLQSQLIRERKVRNDAGIYSFFDSEGIEDIELDPSSFPVGTYEHAEPTLPRGTVVSNF